MQNNDPMDMQQTETTLALTGERMNEIIGAIAREVEKLMDRMDMDIEYPEGDTDGAVELTGDGYGYIEVGELSIEIGCTLSCRYIAWTECWTDPYCCPTFGERYDEAAHLDNVEISDDDGNTPDKDTIDTITKAVNKILKS